MSRTEMQIVYTDDDHQTLEAISIPDGIRISTPGGVVDMTLLEFVEWSGRVSALLAIEAGK